MPNKITHSAVLRRSSSKTSVSIAGLFVGAALGIAFPDLAHARSAEGARDSSPGAYLAAASGIAIIAKEVDGLAQESVEPPSTPAGVTFSIASNGAVAEGSPSVFTITKNGETSETLTVDYASAGMNASSGSDFTAASGTLTFLPSETSKTVSVPTMSDSENEEHEHFKMTLSAPSGAAVLDVTSAVATIDRD